MTGHDSWISEQSKHRNNRAAQAHQSRSNDCSVGIQRPCLRDGDRIWNDFVPLEWINYGLEGNMNQTYKMFAVRLENQTLRARHASRFVSPKLKGFGLQNLDSPRIDIENLHSIKTLRYKAENTNMEFPPKLLKTMKFRASSGNSRISQEPANIMSWLLESQHI